MWVPEEQVWGVYLPLSRILLTVRLRLPPARDLRECRMYSCIGAPFCGPASLRDVAPRLPELECGACRTGFDATDIDLYLQCSNTNELQGAEGVHRVLGAETTGPNAKVYIYTHPHRTTIRGE